MLVSMKEMLADAKKRRYAIPAFDISNYEMARAALDVCEEERSPALLMALGVDLTGRGMGLLTGMISAASRIYSVPVCLHLDHARDFRLIQKAVESGFSSVMFDGSMLPFAENAARTAEIVRFAHSKGLTVEAELGHVGNAIVGNITDSAVNENPEDTLTDPDEAAKFVEETDADALAIAIGTAHGVYKKTPVLRIDRLDEIAAVCDLPLVLHGGSGTPENQLREAIVHGVTKINIYSDVVTAMNQGLKEKLNRLENPAVWPVYAFEEARENMRRVIREKTRIFGSGGKV